MSEQSLKRDIRRHARQEFAGRVRVLWHDERGEQRSCEVACLDISTSGLRVQLPTAVPVRSVVHMRGVGAPLDASGSVRYCRRSGFAFVLGIEFTGGFQYAPGAKTKRWT